MGKYFLIPLLLWAQLINTGPNRRPPSGPRPAPTIRGSNSAGTGGSPTTGIFIPLPSGSVAGDLDLFFCNAQFNITAVGGWSTIALDNGNVWNLYAASKALSAGDITAGQIFCSTAGTGEITGAMIGFIGATSGVRESQHNQIAGSNNVFLTTSGAVLSTDIGVYYESGHGVGVPSLTITPGSGLLTSLQTVTNTNSKAILGDQYMAGGAQTNNFIAATTLSQAIQVIVTP